MSLIANARMYAVTPQVRAAWQSLFAWVADASGIPLAYVEHAAPAPLEALWAREDLGAAFMCGFPFACAAPQPNLIAAPVPSPPRYAGQPRYCTDFIVRADSPSVRLSDTFGGRIGWTVDHSQSGFRAVRHHLLRYGQDHKASLFSAWIGPLVTPRRVIDAVVQGDIDVGPLDSYVHDLLKRHEPETVAKFRTVESTAMTPIPPLVASRTVAEDTLERLRQAVLSSAIETELSAALDTLMVSRFAAINPDDYEPLVAQAREVDAGQLSNPLAPSRTPQGY